MIIGTDGGALAVTDDRLKAGVHKVTLRLLENITHKYDSNYYRLYSHQGIGESGMKWGKRVENRVSPIPNGYMQFWMPIELYRHPVHVYLGLSQILPGSAMTTHIISCNDMYRHVIKLPDFLRSGDRRKKSQPVSQPATPAKTDLSVGIGRFPPKYIGFIYDLAFLTYPEAYPDSCARLTKQTADLAARADRIITISDASKRDIMTAYGVPDERITVAYPGIDKPFHSTGNRYRNKRPYFLSVGALKRQKNIPVLLRAFRQYLDTGSVPADLILVGGDYWLDPGIRETLRNLHLENSVKLTGTVSGGDLAAYYRGALAFVSPSVREGFGLPVAEAMASGCPVIVTGSGAYPEMVKDAGIVVDSRGHGLSDAMKRISGNRTLAGSMKTKGIQRAKIFRWDTFADIVMDTVNQTVS